MSRLVALLLFLAQWGLVGLAAVHHHGPGDLHEDECSVCQVLHAPARLGPFAAKVVLDTTRRKADLDLPVPWEAQRQPIATYCRGPPVIPESLG